MSNPIAIRVCLSLVLACAAAGRAGAKGDRVVLGYSAAWRDDACPAAEYDLATLTHIARAFLVPHPDGTIAVPDGYFNPDLERLARTHDVKLLMSIGGEADTDDNWASIATHPQFRDRFLDALGRLLADHRYDGIDVDWEPAPLTTADGKGYVSLLQALRQRFPHAVLTVALPAGEYWVGHTDLAAVVATVDLVNVMTYDYSGGWGGVAAHGSNLFPPGDCPPQPGYSADEGMHNLIAVHHLPPAKLLMGMTFWGYRFRADRLGGTFPAGKAGWADNLSPGEVRDLLGTGHYLCKWDASAAMPYLERSGGGSVVCYEDPASIRRKCDYARAAGCGGVMIWHVGADVCGRQAPLMDAVAESFAGHGAVLPRSAMERQVGDLRRAAGAPVGPPPGSLSTDALEAAFADGCRARGVQLDQRWRDHAPPATRP